MNFIKRNIPNAITCGNLLCGCLAIVKAFEGDLVWAAYLVGIAAVLDFFDGFAARMLKVSSPIGKDLDSLADMVTFGVVPGVVMYQMIRLACFEDDYFKMTHFSLGITEWEPPSYLFYLKYLALIIPLLSCIRLAKFNNDTRQSDSFVGLPTPANAIFIASLPIIINAAGYNIFDHLGSLLKMGSDTFYPFEFNEEISSYNKPEYLKLLFNPYVLCLMSCVLSYLLIAELPLIALKFKHFKWKGNEIRFIFLGGAIVLLATLQLVGIPLVIVFYILISIVNNIISRKKKVPADNAD